MKKILIAMVIGLLLVAALATTALADNGPHGNFAGNSTDACAGCHRAHTAQSADGNLLKANDEETLCYSCHDGTGAYTDVKDGTYGNGAQGDNGGPLFGGGYNHTVMNNTWTGKGYYDTTLSLSQHSVISAHKVGSSGLTVYGGGDNGSGTGTAFSGTLECTSCHSPHGAAGGSAEATYRILRYNPTGSNGFGVTGSTLFSVNSTILAAGTGGITVQPVTGSTGGATVNDTKLTANGGFMTGTQDHWYTINSDASMDITLAALSKPYGAAAGTKWQPISMGLGDYAPYGRGDAYRRPAVTSNSVSLSCTFNVGTVYPTLNPPTTNNNCPIGKESDGTTSIPSAQLFNNYPQRYGMSYFCSTCHDRYLADSASRSASGGDATFKFRHLSGSIDAGTGLPNVTCVDCHVAHGTSATETALSGGVTLATNADPTQASALLRLNNREMCARCHAATVGIAITYP